MFKKIFQSFRLKRIARQLRKPSGTVAGKVGMMMNKANAALYDFTFENMQVEANESILEIGFGNGNFFNQLVSIAPGVKISGLDYSESMVSIAKEINKDLISTGQLVLTNGTSDRMPFADDSFSKIFCINVIYFWDDPAAHLGEIKRVLKPGGSFYATVRSKQTMEQLPFTKYGFSYYDTEDWKLKLTRAGLTAIDETSLTEPITQANNPGFNFVSFCSVAEKQA